MVSNFKKFFVLIFALFIIVYCNLFVFNKFVAYGQGEGLPMYDVTPEESNYKLCDLQNRDCPSGTVFSCPGNLNNANYLCRCPLKKCRLSVISSRILSSKPEGRAIVSVATAVLGVVGFLVGGPLGASAGGLIGFLVSSGAIRIYESTLNEQGLDNRYICFDPGFVLTEDKIDKQIPKYFVVEKGGIVRGTDQTVENDNLEYVLSTNFRNDFSTPVGNIVPLGAECKLSSDGSQAYWSFNVYKFVADTGGNQQNIDFKNTTICRSPIFSSYDLWGLPVTGTTTFFGCLPNSINGLTSFFVRLIVGLSVFINLLIILINVIFVLSDPTNSENISAAQKRIINSVLILGFIIFVIFFLRIFGIIIVDQNLILGA